ncbi:MAG: DUF192 domain-containing protein [Candidatus Paceibacterota bacterium]
MSETTQNITLLLLTSLAVSFIFLSDAPQEASQSCSHTPLPVSEVAFKEHTLVVELATTVVARECGLSYRKEIKEGHGMLFVFEKEGYHGIWMEHMRFPIDIIWLDEALRVVSIKENVSPDSFPEVFSPSAPALYVLEVNAGEVSSHSFFVGDTIFLR